MDRNRQASQNTLLHNISSYFMICNRINRTNQEPNNFLSSAYKDHLNVYDNRNRITSSNYLYLLN